MSRIKILPLIISILIPLILGGLVGFLTSSSVNVYQNLIKPPLSPPSFLFPIAWTILYILMGISAYLIYISDSPYKKNALIIYIIHLIINFSWSFIFFNMQNFLFAFIWLVILWLLVFLMIKYFAKINKAAAYLQVPYLLWLTFAGYLNLAVYLLNR